MSGVVFSAGVRSEPDRIHRLYGEYVRRQSTWDRSCARGSSRPSSRQRPVQARPPKPPWTASPAGCRTGGPHTADECPQASTRSARRPGSAFAAVPRSMVQAFGSWNLVATAKGAECALRCKSTTWTEHLARRNPQLLVEQWDPERQQSFEAPDSASHDCRGINSVTGRA
jgi:hypothetical protein